MDRVLSAPSVVQEQLYSLCCDERGVLQAMRCLGRAVDKGRVGCEGYVRALRGLARERFLIRVRIGKIAKGLGLEVGTGYGRVGPER